MPKKMPAPAPTAAPGRPKSAAKAEAIVAAAQRLFLEQGYGVTSVDTIATAAGVSKATVYSHFDGKFGLFEAVVAVRQQELLKRLAPTNEPTGDVRTDLVTFAVSLSSAVLQPRYRDWDRLVFAESSRHPELARSLFKAGPKLVHKRLDAILSDYAAAGQLAIDDTAAAAEHLIGLVLGFEFVRGLMASQPKRSRRFWTDRAEGLVDLFLARYAVGPPERTP